MGRDEAGRERGRRFGAEEVGGLIEERSIRLLYAQQIVHRDGKRVIERGMGKKYRKRERIKEKEKEAPRCMGPLCTTKS